MEKKPEPPGASGGKAPQESKQRPAAGNRKNPGKVSVNLKFGQARRDRIFVG